MQWNWIGRSVSGLVKRHGGGVGSGSLDRLVIYIGLYIYILYILDYIYWLYILD